MPGRSKKRKLSGVKPRVFIAHTSFVRDVGALAPERVYHYAKYDGNTMLVFLCYFKMV
jgi:hypothetical protein